MTQLFDFVDEDISNEPGTGTVNLGGNPLTGHRVFNDVLASTDTAIATFYLETPNDDANDWETSIVTFTDATPDTLTRVVVASSNGDALITLTSSHRVRMSANAKVLSDINFGTPTAGTLRVGPGAGNDAMTGIDNTLMGTNAASGITSGQENAVYGKDAGTGITNESLCCYFGKDAGKGHTGASNVGVGKDCMGGAGNGTGSLNCMGGVFSGDVMTSADSVSAWGENSFGSLTSGRRGVAIGSLAGTGITTGDNGIWIGHRGGGEAGADYQISIGYRADAAGSNQGVLGSQYSGAHVSDWYFNGHDSASPDSVVLHGAGGFGTDITGADITIAGGKPTGAGIGGSFKVSTAPAGSTGTTLGTLVDRLEIDELGNIVPGTAALATDADDGFLFMTTSAGVPTGTPPTYTGRVAFHYDTSNNDFYIYNGSWRSVALT